MLARLELIDGVARAEVDYGGNYMRLMVDGVGGRDATALLRELGYEPEPVAAGDMTGAKWYDVQSVHELSAVEAGVIARRVVGRFGQKARLQHETADRLDSAVGAALRDGFERSRGRIDLTPGQFRREAVESVRAAALTVLGETEAEAFVTTLEADLDEDHTRDAGL